MGNTESNVTSGVKKQAGTSEQPVYKLVNLKGGGLLVDMMKRAAQTKQYAELDHAIKTKVEPFLYNKGKGRLIPISQLVLMRNCERSRTKLLPPLKNMEDPESEFDIDKDGYPGDLKAAPDGYKDDFHDLNKKYRDVCWDLKKRGAVGETCLHLCMLNATSIHADLAKRLLKFYPKLINDIYMCDEYYGENVLHIAIVNEDPAMVKFLLDAGANFHERCVGNFMCPEDQKATRTDSLDHEWVNLSPETNYEGYVYWGEYPLSFAACLGQEECYRLMLARGANPDNQDTNGNTVLHMLVIHNKLSTFDMAYEIGANLSLKNVKCLTPLTLAAKLARVELFFHIMNIEREIYWQIGSITCAAYPLSQIDTIDNETGNISKNSALNLVVFGDKEEHLELMDGVLIDLLVSKWNTYVKFRFYRQFILFVFYFLISLICFTLRPGPPTEESGPGILNGTQQNTTSLDVFNVTPPAETINDAGIILDKKTLSNLVLLNLLNFTEEEIRNRTRDLPVNKTGKHFGKLNAKDAYDEMKLNNKAEVVTEAFNLMNSASGIPDKNDSEEFDLKSKTFLTIDEFSENITQRNRTLVDYRSKNSIDERTKTINGNESMINQTQKKEELSKVNLLAEMGKIRLKELLRELRKRETETFEDSSDGNGDGDLNAIPKQNETQGEGEEADDLDCRLLSYETAEDKIRIAAEIALEIGSILYITAALREARFLGINMFIENLMTAPSRVMFLGSCCIMQVIPWLRFTCNAETEDIVAVIIMLTTAPYYLFFCRGFKTVGPFVVMIYRMIMGDLLRFVCIYTVFVMGFSQAYYIIFLSFDNPVTPDGVDDSMTNPMQSPVESVMAMFLMSLTNFGDYYGAFEKTDHEFIAKLMFVIYMAIVAVLLVNMLIAMMGNTYQKIAETRNEWQRQWARIVLVVERGVSPHERLKKLMLYSQPMSDGRRALVLRLHQTPEDKEEMKDILDMKRVHNRMVQRRKAKGKRNLSFTGSPKHGAKHHLTGPVPPLKSIPPKPKA